MKGAQCTGWCQRKRAKAGTELPYIRSDAAAVRRDPHLEAFVALEKPAVCQKPNEELLGDGATAIGVKGSEDLATYF